MALKHAALALGLLLAPGGVAFADGVDDVLAGSEWGFAGEDAAFVKFGPDGQVSGKSFCNRFMGGYELGDAGTIAIGPLAATRMACPGDAMEKERDFLGKLESAKSYTREGIALRLNDAGGLALLELTQRDAD